MKIPESCRPAATHTLIPKYLTLKIFVFLQLTANPQAISHYIQKPFPKSQSGTWNTRTTCDRGPVILRLARGTGSGVITICIPITTPVCGDWSTSGLHPGPKHQDCADGGGGGGGDGRNGTRVVAHNRTEGLCGADRRSQAFYSRHGHFGTAL